MRAEHTEHISLIVRLQMEKAVPRQYAFERSPQGQSSHVSDHPLVPREAAPAQGNHRRRAVDAGNLQAATNQIRGDRHAPAAPEIENCSTRWQRIGKTIVPTLVVPITFAAVGIPLDRMSLIVSNDFVGKVRHRVQMYAADGVRNAS